MFFEKGIDHRATKELTLVKKKVELAAFTLGRRSRSCCIVFGCGRTGSAVAVDQITRVNAEIRILEAAINGCRVWRMDAIKSTRVDQFKELQKQASDKSRELESLTSKTAKLLTQIAELEGCDYAPGGHAGIIAAACRNRRTPAQSTGPGGVRDSGHRFGGSRKHNRVRRNRAGNCPSPISRPIGRASASWLDASLGIRCARHYRGFGEHPCRVRLVWDAEGINVRESYVFCPELTQRHPGGESFVIASGTFKAIPQSTVGRDHQAPVEVPARGGWYRN